MATRHPPDGDYDLKTYSSELCRPVVANIFLLASATKNIHLRGPTAISEKKAPGVSLGVSLHFLRCERKLRIEAT